MKITNVLRSMLGTVLMGLAAFASEGQALDLHRVTADQVVRSIRNWMVIDARPRKVWQEGHLPGALSFSWETYTRIDTQGVRYRTLPPEELAAVLGSLGISHKDPLLVYGDADSSWGGEGWAVWVLAWIGHKGPVYFLDGGIQAWKERGHGLTRSLPVSRKPVTYQVRVDGSLICSADELAARGKDVALVDTRGYLTEWLPGHLPGAVHIPWEKFYQGKNRTALAPAKLKALLKENGVDVRKPVVYYCTGGIRSGYAWLVHALSGLPAAVNFEGGTEEWNMKQDLVRF